MPDRANSFFSDFSFGALITIRALLSPVAVGASALIVERTGKVLLARHSYMKGWSLPGGGVGRTEPPIEAMLREVSEEIGSVRSDTPQLVGVFSRRAGYATNLIVLYRLDNAQVSFTPNWEIREIVFADPADPPPGTTAGTRRRLLEYANKTPPSPIW